MKTVQHIYVIYPVDTWHDVQNIHYKASALYHCSFMEHIITVRAMCHSSSRMALAEKLALLEHWPTWLDWTLESQTFHVPKCRIRFDNCKPDAENCCKRNRRPGTGACEDLF
jgi:hypothetical protein